MWWFFFYNLFKSLLGRQLSRYRMKIGEKIFIEKWTSRNSLFLSHLVLAASTIDLWLSKDKIRLFFLLFGSVKPRAFLWIFFFFLAWNFQNSNYKTLRCRLTFFLSDFLSTARLFDTITIKRKHWPLELFWYMRKFCPTIVRRVR